MWHGVTSVQYVHKGYELWVAEMYRIARIKFVWVYNSGLYSALFVSYGGVGHDGDLLL